MAAETLADGWESLSCMISASVSIASGVNFSHKARTSERFSIPHRRFFLQASSRGDGAEFAPVTGTLDSFGQEILAVFCPLGDGIDTPMSSQS